MGQFSYYNMRFRKDVHTDAVIVSGEVRNDSSRDYANVVFRIRLLLGTEIAGETLFTLVDFHRGVVRNFEKMVEGASSGILRRSFNFEIYLEGGY